MDSHFLNLPANGHLQPAPEAPLLEPQYFSHSSFGAYSGRQLHNSELFPPVDMDSSKNLQIPGKPQLSPENSELLDGSGDFANDYIIRKVLNTDRSGSDNLVASEATDG
jgi:hypothetical protein